jgi:cytochrome c oxidase cbb3-type subunit 3
VQLSDGSTKTIARQTPDQPKIEVHNPMQGHIDLLPKYTDDQIHNITAYLATLK